MDWFVADATGMPYSPKDVNAKMEILYAVEEK